MNDPDQSQAPREVPVEGPGLPDLLGLSALALCVVLVVSIAIGVGGERAYTEHLRAAMLIGVVLAVEVAAVAIWLWLAVSAQHRRLSQATLWTRDSLRDAIQGRDHLSGAARDLSDAAKALAACISDQRELAGALRAVAEAQGIDVVSIGGRRE